MSLTISLCIALAAFAAQPQPQAKSIPLPQSSDLLKYSSPKGRWATFTFYFSNGQRMVSRGERNRLNRQRRINQRQETAWRFEGYTMVVPFVPITSAAISLVEQPEIEMQWRSTDGEWVTTDPGSQRVAPVDLGPGESPYYRVESDELIVTDVIAAKSVIRYACFETEFNEQAAERVGWPSSWPIEAQSLLGPERYISLQPDGEEFANTQLVPDLLKRWTNGKDPKDIPPAQLAKWLAGSVQEFVRVVRPGRAEARDLRQRGMTVPGHTYLDVRTAEQIINDPRGSPHDMTVLLTAIYRQAGLPARMVIGFQASEDDGEQELKSKDRIRSWVEFALYDEDKDELTWVPVDVVRLRESSSRMKPLTEPWMYFGDHDELDQVVPFAYHLVPPAEFPYFGTPAMHGFEMKPQNPNDALMSVGTMTSSDRPKRSDD